MDNKFQTSFIPKKSLDDNRKVSVKTPISIFSVFATIVIVVTVVASLGLWGYSYFLDKQIVDSGKRLQEANATFKDEDVNEVLAFDNKLKSAATLINNHIAMSSVFEFLQENTLKNLRYDSFSIEYFSPNRVSVTMKGQARSFGAVARQAELFTSSSTKRLFTEPVFSDVTSDEKGLISFSFISAIDPNLILYKNNL